MAWTYTANPAAVPNDMVRFLLGDTDSTDPLCQDSEVGFAISTDSNPYRAAAFLADRLAARFTRDEAISADGVSLSGQSRAPAFRLLAKSLRADAARYPGAPVDQSRPAGTLVLTGVRPATMDAVDAQTDRIGSAFVRQNEADVLNWFPAGTGGRL